MFMPSIENFEMVSKMKQQKTMLVFLPNYLMLSLPLLNGTNVEPKDGVFKV